MRKRYCFLVPTVIGVVVLVGLLGWISNREREPRYAGKKLSDWVQELTLNGLEADSRIKQANEAIRQIGTNALPHLVKWIAYEPPDWKMRLRRAAVHWPFEFGREWMTVDKKDRRAYGARLAFHVFGPEAAAAIPGLAKVAANSSRKSGAARAVGALGDIGPAALPTLVVVFTNQPQTTLGLGALYQIRHLGSNALPATSLLSRSAK